MAAGRSCLIPKSTSCRRYPKRSGKRFELCANTWHCRYLQSDGGGALQFSPEGKDATATCDFVTGEITTEKGAIKCDHANTEVLPAVAPTCTETGLTAGSRCLDCGLVLTEQQVVEANGHTEAEAIVENENPATCTKDGSYDSVIKCAVCQAELSRTTHTVQALPHIPGEDDGDCTTSILCTRENCGQVVEEGNATHTMNADNTACTVCQFKQAVAIKSQLEETYDLYELDNDEQIVLDLSKNVKSADGLTLTYSVGDTPVENNLYTVALANSTFTVTVSYGEDKSVSYTYTIKVIDTTANRLVNGGFEDGLYGWTKVGNIGDVSSEKTYWTEAIEFGMDGDKMFSAYAPGAQESAVGTLTSSTFTVGGSGFVTFKVGAMKDGNYVYIDVVDAETKQILARYYNGLWAEKTNEVKSGCTLVAYKADLSAFMDKEVFFRISDNADSGYGLFFVDSFITYYENAPEGFNNATPVSYKVSGTIYDVFNGGFEMGNVQGWWNKGAVEGAVPGAVTGADAFFSGVAYGKEGTYLYSGVEDHGAGNGREGNRGTLTSSAFELGGTGYISYMLGGGNDLCYVQVIDATTNEVLAMYRQQALDGAVLKTYVANLSAYIGRTIRIQLVDNSTNEWGCVSFDNVVTYYPTTETLPAGAIEAKDIKATFKYTLANGGFEYRLDGWTLVRTAGETDIGYVSEQEVFWKNADKSYNKDGRFLFTGVEDTNGFMEGGQGTLTSSHFVIGGSGFITFKLGGGYNPECYIEIVDAETGSAIAKFHNPNADSNEGRMFQFKADLSEFQNKEVYIRVVDNAVNAWGCMAVDSFVTYYETAEQLPEATLLSNLLVAE